jgi:hypothetical protein
MFIARAAAAFGAVLMCASLAPPGINPGLC